MGYIYITEERLKKLQTKKIYYTKKISQYRKINLIQRLKWKKYFTLNLSRNLPIYERNILLWICLETCLFMKEIFYFEFV